MLIPVIVSGGSGTRLWPLSRATYPKQFIRFNGHGLSPLGATLRRLKTDGFSAPIIVCNNAHRFLVREELDGAALAPEAVILEPFGRNTGPAVAVAALAALRKDPDAILAVMPSDHLVKNEAGFVARLKQAAKVAAEGRLVLFGITPASPHTGYGYIRQGAPLNCAGGAFSVDAFAEKPDAATAAGYVADGRYLWNSGIFVLNARAFLGELERLAPDVLEAARSALAGAREDLGFERLDDVAFARAPNISIDCAVMEKTKAAAVLPLDVGWSDIGSWSSLWEATEKDDAENAVSGDALLIDAAGCFVHSERSLVAAIGVDDLVIVDTPDALLVATKERAQEVSRVVERLQQANRKEHAQHLRSHRPWGYFETLSVGERFQVKHLHVKPNGKLSLQMHHHRSEHWVVVRGTAKVTIGEVEKLVQENESVYITATHWHRLENPGKVALELIEVQIGSYLGEDDIVRAEDIYQRV